MASIITVTESAGEITVTDAGTYSVVTVSDETSTIYVGEPGPQGAAGEGVPTGGTTDQGLVKASGTNYDTEWANVVQSNPGSGQYRIKGIYLDSSKHIVVVYDEDAEA